MNAENINLENLSEEQLLKALAEKRKNKNAQRETYKALVLETVPKAIFKLATVSDMLSQAKRDTFQYFEDVLTLKNEVYGLKEKQRSHTFTTEKEEITIGYRIIDGWDDTATIGVEKVKKVIESMSKNTETALLVGTLMNLLKPDSNGNLKASRVLELQKEAEKYNNPEFTDGVDIISKAFKPVRSSWFIEAYLIDQGKKTNIPLNISSVDFAEGYKFDFFSEDIKTELENKD